MSHIRIRLFGSPRIEQNSQPFSLGVRKGIALLVYLAVTRQPHSRDALATLFWPESNQQEARASLRRMLYRLNQFFKSEAVISIHDLVQLDPSLDLWLDVSEFREATAQCLQGDGAAIHDAGLRQQWEDAVALYADDFMAGFSLPDCAEFDDWQFFQREELRQSLATVLGQLMGFYEQQTQYEKAISFARRWLALDRMHELVHRHLMRIYACAGQHSSALRQYEECARILDEELGVEPDAETTELYEAIRLRRFPEESRRTTATPRPSADHPPQPHSTDPTSPVRYPLPDEALPLIGRKGELAQLRNMLANPYCRLITIVGLGGMGKTHLTLQAAHNAAGESSFLDGVLFVTLTNKAAKVNPATNIAFALADALDLTLSAQIEPIPQVLTFLHTRKMLIIFDNFEDLLHADEELHAESALDLIEEILEGARDVKLLVTSREPLQLQAEWRFDLQGLSFPLGETQTETHLEPLDTYSAVHLFVQSARQVQPSFEITAQNAAAIYRLCRLVAGSPLALKLAAAWVRIFTCQRIVDDLEENMSLLSTQMRNVPARQRSMRAIFDYTWYLLSEEEQRLFLAVSIFRGGFSEAAARAVADATPPLLAALLDRGLLQVQSTVQGIRYTLHEMTRQYAVDRLAADPPYMQQVRDRHTNYYAHFLSALVDDIIGNKQPEAVAAIHQEIDNVEAMWAHLLATADLDLLQKAVKPLWRYHWSRTPGQEGKQFIAAAISAVMASDKAQAHPALRVVLSILYAMCGEVHYFLGEYDLANDDFQVARDLARQLGLRKEEMDMVLILSSIARWRGETTDAETSLLEALAFYQEIGNRNCEADAQHELAQLYVYTGRYAEARICAAASLSISLELGRPDWIGWALDVLGWLSFCCGDYADARERYIDSLSYFERSHHQLGIALAWGGLGMVAWAEGRSGWVEAQNNMARSLMLCRHMNHQFHTSSRLCILAQICNDAEEYAQAEEYAREGLEIAQKVESSLFTSLNLCCLAESLYYRGNMEQSRDYLREAIKLAYEMGQMPALTSALLCYATLLVIESELAEDVDNAQSSKRMQAMALLQRVTEHPSCWAIYQEKAKRLLREVHRKWPAASATKAAASYNPLSPFDAQVLEILQDGDDQVLAIDLISREEARGEE